MLRFTKKTEYALLSLQFIANKEGTLVSAKEIAESLGLSFEIIAKVLHLLGKSGLTQSIQGAQGGYILQKSPSTISLSDVISAIEGKPSQLVECVSTDDMEDQECSCTVYSSCTIKDPMITIQKRMDEMLTSITIQDFLHTPVYHKISEPISTT
ncbi:MAG: RrF2 family transcriptional regulator [Candidatus Kapaibacteriota bacterium]